MRYSALALLLLTPAWSFSPPAATTVTLTPFHDTWVNSATPDLSYGNSAYLSTEVSSSGVERCYLQFDTATLAGTTISSAVLSLWVVRENTGGDPSDVWELYPITSAWTDALTWNLSQSLTKGALVTTVPSTDYGATNTVAPPKKVDFDIKSLVQTWASGGVNKGLMIRLSDTANADIRFASLEDPDATLHPSLTVTYTTGTPPPPPPGPTASLVPFHDTYVTSASPDLSFGNAAFLLAENDSSLTGRGYMQFDTAGLAGATVSSAILKLWVVRENGGGDANDVFEVYPINSAWTDALTYNQSLALVKGTLVSSVASTNYGTALAVSPAQEVDFDITSLVQTWASGGINHGLMVQLIPSANADYRFASLEEPNAAYHPILDVTTTSGTSTPTPTPIPTPTTTPTPSAASSGGGGGGDSKCGCGSVAGPWTSGWIPGIAGLALLLALGLRR